MIHIDILCVGKIKEAYLKEAIMEYEKRLSKYCSLKIVEIPDEPIPAKASSAIEMQIKEKEGQAMLSAMKRESYGIALDRQGITYTSEEFSEKIENLAMQTSHITFLIGGSLGMSSTVLQACKEKISFSKMTFPHPLMRVILLEQLFRAYKIAHHETYHR